MRIVSDPKHEWYEELCALAAIGELSSSEFEELQQHLTRCRECRELNAEFRRISADDLGALAVLKKLEPIEAGFDPSTNEDELLNRTLQRARREADLNASFKRVELFPANRGTFSRYLRALDWLQHPVLVYAAAALVLCAGAIVLGLRVREVQLTPTLQELSSQLSTWKSRAHVAEAKEKSTAKLLSSTQTERAKLQQLLAEMQTKYAAVEATRAADETQLSELHTQMEESGKELQEAKNGETGKEKALADLQAQLRELDARAAQQDKTIANLRTRLLEEAPRQAEAQNFDDADAKQLFGARDLHIIDVYDVASNGKTRRSYGRVYYVARKLLIFYAFDLQDPRRNRMPAAFQAWGYEQASDRSPRNLGLFSLDDVAENRWVLKVNNPRVLERIDAVFVTLEAPNGSPSPRGRRVLYANLAGPANHP